MACPATCGHGIIWLRLLPRAMYWSMALPQPRVTSMSVAQATTKGITDAQGLGQHPEAMLVPEDHTAVGAMKIQMSCTATWGHDFQPEFCPRNMPGSMALLQPRSVLRSVASVAIQGRVTAQGLCQYLGPCWSPGIMLLPGPCSSERHMVLP